MKERELLVKEEIIDVVVRVRRNEMGEKMRGFKIPFNPPLIKTRIHIGALLPRTSITPGKWVLFAYQISTSPRRMDATWLSMILSGCPISSTRKLGMWVVTFA